jgi:hypothetical protein
MTKKKEQEVTQLEFVPNTSINVELSQSDLISVIIQDQIEIWENELKEAEQKLSDFDSEFKQDLVFSEGIRKIVQEKCGILGSLELEARISYSSFKRNIHYPVQLGARQNLNGIEIGISYQIPAQLVQKAMHAELSLLEAKEKERTALVSDIIRIQELIDNQSRFESKIRAEITRKILKEGGNEKVASNLEAMRIAIFSDKKLLK